MRKMWSGTGAVAAIALGIATPATAAPARQAYDLPAQPLAQAILDVGTRSGVSIAAPTELLEGKRAGPLAGSLTAAEAVKRLLSGSGLRARIVEDGIVIEPDPGVANGAGGARDETAEVVVTGTRIRGAPVASPVTRLSADRIRNEGQATLAEAVRTIPQNFGGGQNPGVGFNVPAANGVNVGSATSINLRGLGSDATLTLVNGHRLSYSASRQAIDVSTIPLGAVERIEIVADGASALYGSDAVAGVANIVLKRSATGLETSARLGGSTEGGGFEQRYGATTGARWSSGGFVTAYEFGRVTAIEGRDRSYTAARQPALVLMPFMRSHSATVSGYHGLTERLTFELDALYHNRFSKTAYALNAAGNITTSGAEFIYRSKSFVIAPTLRLALGGGWRTFLTGSYGQDRTYYDVTSYSAGRATVTPDSCYCNNAKTVELGGDGSLLQLPGGAAKLALGIGYRSNHFVRFNGVGATTNVARDQDSYFAYGEVSLPLVAPAQAVHMVEQLSLSAALRYERYPGVDEIATPKVGLIYAPSDAVTLKGSWGKSFRSPTLYQQYQARNVVLAEPFVFGGTGFPATATAILLQGGNPDLKPERATTWSATLDLHPAALGGGRLQLSYFSTRYRDRIVTPIAFLGQALSNPLFADRILLNPSPAFLAEIIASAVSFGNATSGAYDPARVAVFIDAQNVNAARQSIRGVDATFDHELRLDGGRDRLGVTLSATYLASDQQLGPGKPVTQLAGILFNPPHFRARGGLSWLRGDLRLSANVNYIGSVEDTRRAIPVEVVPQMTLDLAARYRTGPNRGLFSNLDVVLSAQNVFHDRPAPIATTLLYDAPFDSTNQSAIGRFVSVSVAKRW